MGTFKQLYLIPKGKLAKSAMEIRDRSFVGGDPDYADNFNRKIQVLFDRIKNHDVGGILLGEIGLSENGDKKVLWVKEFRLAPKGPQVKKIMAEMDGPWDKRLKP